MDGWIGNICVSNVGLVCLVEISKGVCADNKNALKDQI
jgi:hypothetical protein